MPEPPWGCEGDREPLLEIWHAVILGLVEGITEYLPISSTGHLIITASLLGLDGPERKAGVDAFNIVIQGGAILAVVGLYRARVLQMLRGVIGRDAPGLRLAINLFIAFLPAAILGLLLDDVIEAYLFNPPAVLAALLVGGVYMLVVDRAVTKRRDEETKRRSDEETDSLSELRPSQALVIGLLQCVALWPGTSRSMMTITGGMLAGLRPAQAAEFSFLLALPTLGAACLYKAAKNTDELSALGGPAMIAGLVTATVSAALAVSWLVGFLNRHGLALFAWYRFGLCALMLLLWLVGWVRIEG